MENELQKPFIPYHFAKKHHLIVKSITNDQAEIIHRKTVNFNALAEVKRLLNCHLILKEVNDQAFQEQLTRQYESINTITLATAKMEDEIDLAFLADQLPNNEDILESRDDAPIIQLINALFSQAIKQKASDIHIETYESRVVIRYRIDGLLTEILEIQRAIAPLVISRVKVMAKLNIAEKRIPQDGRISLHLGAHNIDVRVSTLPSNHGERIVLRILDKQSARLDLNYLGMSCKNLELIKKLITQPYGIILVTGPTGSGKTTSLYAMLTQLNQKSRNILTIEDPIEYDLAGIGQTQVNTKVQMTFAKGLRAILRQDPDIVMVGEIRDLETAEIAVQASLTGHLVLSTLHTNSALGAITRLYDMGIEPFLLSSSLIGLIAQRLVRKLCDNCKSPHHLTVAERDLLDLNSSNEFLVFEPNGCHNCNQTGYRGRTGIYEIVLLDETLKAMIHRKENILKMANYIQPTVPTIRDDGFKAVLEGKTSIAEIIRVTAQT